MTEKFERDELKETREKPPILYHASHCADISELKPSLSPRDQQEGEVVFSSPDLACATMFLAPSDDSWTMRGGLRADLQDKKLYYMVISDEQRFREIDKGGWIYTLPSESFSCDYEKGMGQSEWVSREVVKPKDKQHFPSALDAMIANNVQVYFTDKEQFSRLREILENIKKVEDDAEKESCHKLLMEVVKGMVSENKKQKKNFEDIEKFVSKIQSDSY